MRHIPGNIQAIIEPVVESLGYELVGAEYQVQGHQGLLRVYIDAEDGVNVDDCARVSHQLSGVLDVEDVIKGKYRLEVSSPGLDRPLFTLAHFERFAGHQAKLRLVAPIGGQRKFKGVLQGVEDGQVIVNIGENELVLALNAIDKANLIPEF